MIDLTSPFTIIYLANAIIQSDLQMSITEAVKLTIRCYDPNAVHDFGLI